MLIGKGRSRRRKAQPGLAYGCARRPFLDHCLRASTGSSYSIVGFTSTFEQNLASLALADGSRIVTRTRSHRDGRRQLRRQMGLSSTELSVARLRVHRRGRLSFPELVERIGRGDPRADGIRGFVHRAGERRSISARRRSCASSTALPYPNYDDFFDQFAPVGLPTEVAPSLQIETARGCWWGAKHPLHVLRAQSRRDDVPRQVAGARARRNRAPRRRATASTSSAPSTTSSACSTSARLLPELKRRELGVHFFYETKSNLKEEQVA